MIRNMLTYTNENAQRIEVIESEEMETTYFLNVSENRIEYTFAEVKNYWQDIIEKVIETIEKEEYIKIYDDYIEPLKQFIDEELENEPKQETLIKFRELANI